MEYFPNAGTKLHNDKIRWITFNYVFIVQKKKASESYPRHFLLNILAHYQTWFYLWQYFFYSII